MSRECVTPMESKQSPDTAAAQKMPTVKALDDVIVRLGELDQKIEHIIENIHDSLYRLKSVPPEREQEEEDAE